MDVSPRRNSRPSLDDFFIVAREHGHFTADLPVWASTRSGVVAFEDRAANAVEKVDLPEVPGAFHLLNVLSGDECDQFVQISDTLGFHEDAPVSLPRKIRHNRSFNWIVDESVEGPVWQRSQGFFDASTFTDEEPKGQKA